MQALAQTRCNSSYILFNFPPGQTPTPIRSLGKNPQIKCLRNITNKSSFFQAIQTCKNNPEYEQDFAELDKLLKEIGFANGLNDKSFTEESLLYDTIPYGSKGMLGYKKNKKIGYEYSILIPDHYKGIAGWRITSPTGCYVYVFTKCGNAFYPERPICTPPPCPEINIVIDSASIPVPCQFSLVKRKIITTYRIIYAKTVKQEQSQQQQEQRKTQVTVDNRTLIFYDTLELEEKVCPDTAYFVYNTPVKESFKICTDSTKNISVSLQLGRVSLSTGSGNLAPVARTIEIRVSRRSFRKIKKIIKSGPDLRKFPPLQQSQQQQ
jgi:hypothetical protein